MFSLDVLMVCKQLVKQRPLSNSILLSALEPMNLFPHINYCFEILLPKMLLMAAHLGSLRQGQLWTVLWFGPLAGGVVVFSGAEAAARRHVLLTVFVFMSLTWPWLTWCFFCGLPRCWATSHTITAGPLANSPASWSYSCEAWGYMPPLSSSVPWPWSAAFAFWSLCGLDCVAPPGPFL